MPAREVDCLKWEADEGNATAQYAMHLSTGDAGPDKLREAVKYFKHSADQDLCGDNIVMLVVCVKGLEFQLIVLKLPTI
jgi:hypothetical protein